MSGFVVTGIGTGIGKTIVSGLICRATGWNYWKPIQAGDLHELDSDTVRKIAPYSAILPEFKLLTTPQSPHEAARVDGVNLHLSDFVLPQFDKTTLVEGAGGIMVPLNDNGLTYLDVFESWNLPIIVVTKHYLGSINHTLLTLETLINRRLTIACLVINGDRHEPSERIYRTRFPEIPVNHFPTLDLSNQEEIKQAISLWKTIG